MRVAIVHDYLTQFGGAERVLQALMELFPHAPVFTLVYAPENLHVSLDERRLRTSFLQRLPGARRHHRYFPLQPLFFGRNRMCIGSHGRQTNLIHSMDKYKCH